MHQTIDLNQKLYLKASMLKLQSLKQGNISELRENTGNSVLPKLDLIEKNGFQIRNQLEKIAQKHVPIAQ